MRSPLISTLLLASQFLFFHHPAAQSSTPSSSCPCTLRGSVVDSVSGRPVPHALVKLTAPSPRAALTDSEGGFQFESLPAFQLRAVPAVHLRVRVPVQPPTPVTVTTEAPDSEGNYQETSSSTSEVESSPDVALALKIGETYTDQIEPARKQIAPGIVELSGIPPGQIEVNIMSGSIVNMVTGQEDSIVSHGRTLNLSGDAEVDLSAQGDSAVSGVVLSSQFFAAGAPPAQTSPNQSSPDQATLEEAATVQALQERVSNATIAFRSLKTGESYDATISDRGRFSFASSTLPADAYEVELTQGGLQVSTLEATGATVSGRTIEIPDSQPVNITVHAAEANCALSGLALKNGKPVAGAMFFSFPRIPATICLSTIATKATPTVLSLCPRFSPAATTSSPLKMAGTSSGPIPTSCFNTSPAANPSS